MAVICVFCGSRPGSDPAFMSAAADMGRAIALAGHTLVYGAGNVGLMGAVADAALAAGGQVIGVIPRLLVEQEVCHRGLGELLVVDDMHVRKRLMCERSDAFIVLPGGIGTVDELSEVMCWNQLGIHAKRVAFLDVAGYWSPFLAFLDGMAVAGFIPRQEVADLVVAGTPSALLTRLCPGVAGPGG